MKFFGFEITRARQKGVVGPIDLSPTLWTPLLHEANTGFWQRGVKVDKETALSFSSLFACVTLIASDISKLGVRLVRMDDDGIWQQTENPAYSPVLRKPNRFQTRGKFIESWILSKLIHGNTYAIKVRDNRNVVVALYILDPRLVQPLVAPGAAVFYRLQADNMTNVENAVVVPASEIIHDVMNPIYHPLIGVSPISACALGVSQGVEIQKTSARFFQNGARPGGVLTAPGTIAQATAERLKTEWDQKFGGENVGKVAVLGDGLKFEHLAVNPVDAQLIEQLKYSSEMVCTAFHVPPYKVGVGPTPTYQNAAVLNQIYYADCLQKLMKDFESAFDEGLGIGEDLGIGVEFIIDDLLMMDAQTQMLVLKEGVGAKIIKPNEARKRLNLSPTDGGDELWGQQQDHSLSALSRRDEAMEIPSTLVPSPAETLPPEEPPDERERRLLAAFGDVVRLQIEQSAPARADDPDFAAISQMIAESAAEKAVAAVKEKTPKDEAPSFDHAAFLKTFEKLLAA